METDGPRLAEPGEFDDIAGLLNRCFGFDVPPRMPHCFDPDRLERHAVVVANGEVVSHVACVPAELVAGDAGIDCYGIAGVATDTAHRGKGYMDDLLGFWLERLEDRGAPLAELEGDRRRYGRYGWENAGREYRYEITGRSFAGAHDESPPDTVAEYTGTDEQLELIEACHESERFRIARERSDYETLLGQSGLETLCYPDGPAYLSYRGEESPSVLEFGGDEAGVRALLATVLAESVDDRLLLYAHPLHPLNETFRRGADDWTQLPHRKLNVLDLRATLEAFEPLLAERWRRVHGRTRGRVTLGVRGEEGSAVSLSYTPGDVSCRPFEGDPEISLSRTEMAQLLFGFPDQWRSRKRRDPLLSTTLPLDYYFWETETI